MIDSCRDEVSGGKTQVFNWHWEADVRIARDEARC